LDKGANDDSGISTIEKNPKLIYRRAVGVQVDEVKLVKIERLEKLAVVSHENSRPSILDVNSENINGLARFLVELFPQDAVPMIGVQHADRLRINRFERVKP
tara:strand:+ start:761 stop:1066 length:306 start_codon:yes stop_codon:yes gene_type:complete